LEENSEIPKIRVVSGQRNFQYVLHIGSNVGDREEYLRAAREMLLNKFGGPQEFSPVYETQPWGVKEQGFFLNQAVVGRTELHPYKFLRCCKSIEYDLGRSKAKNWGPREIDIDIIFFHSCIIGTSDLTIPHPYLKERKFVLKPLIDLIPNFVDPISEHTVYQIYEQCEDPLAVELFKQTSDVGN